MHNDMDKQGKIYVYNIKVDHRILVEELNKNRTSLICVLNTNIQKYPLIHILDGKFIKKLDTYITKIDELLIIEFINKKSNKSEGKLILKSNMSGFEKEFKLKCLEYYTNFQEIITKQVFPESN